MLPRTQRQKEVLDYITRFLAKHGHEPSYAQIANRIEARDGEIVVALIDRARATLKRLFRFGDEVELRPSNAQLEPIRVHASRVEVQGIFRGLLRPNA